VKQYDSPQLTLLDRIQTQIQDFRSINPRQPPELELDYITVLKLRRELQENAERLQPDTPLPDLEAESDDLFQNAGEKRSRVH